VGSQVVYRTRGATGWTETAIDNGISPLCDVAIAVSASGAVGIAWFDPSNKDLRYASIVNGTPAIELVATTGDVGRGPSVTFDTAGAPMVSYFALGGTNPTVRLARRGASNWTSEDVVTQAFNTQRPATVVRMVGSDIHVIAGDTGQPQFNNQAGGITQAIKSGNTWSLFTLGAAARMVRHGTGVGVDGLRAAWASWEPSSAFSAQFFTDTRPRGLDLVQLSTSQLGYEAALANGPTPMMFRRNGITTTAYQRRNGVWQALTLPSTVSPTLVQDATWAAQHNWLLGASVLIEAPVCTPQCTARTCGDDGCGGSCGTCAANSYCAPAGVCTGWKIEPVPTTEWSSVSARRSLDQSLHVVQSDAPYRYPRVGPVDSTRRDASGFSWPLRIAGSVTFNPFAFDVSPNGVPMFAYRQPTGIGSNAEVRLASWNGTGWTSQLLASPDQNDTPPALTFDANGAHVFAPAMNGGPIHYVVGPAGVTTSGTSFITSRDLESFSVTAQGNGAFHAAYQQRTTLFGTEYATEYQAIGPASPQATAGVIATPVSLACQPRVVLTPTEVLMVAGGYGAWRFARSTGGAFTIDTGPLDNQDSTPELALKPNGTPRMIYVTRVSPPHVAVLEKVNGTWTEVDTIPTLGGQGDLSAFIDSAGVTHVLFRDGVSLFYGRK
jgi:hypothetical protein